MTDENDTDELVLTVNDKEALATALLADKILYSGTRYVDNTGHA